MFLLFFRRQKRKNDFKRDDPEFQRERRRISKLLLNDHYDTEKGSSHRVWIYSINVCMFIHVHISACTCGTFCLHTLGKYMYMYLLFLKGIHTTCNDVHAHVWILLYWPR